MPALQLDILEELETLIGDRLPDLLRLFQAESTALYQSMHRAIAENARDDLRLYAHSLKGASSNLGAMDLRCCCEQIEQRALNASTSELETLCKRLEICHGEAIEAVSQRLGVA